MTVLCIVLGVLGVGSMVGLALAVLYDMARDLLGLL